MEITYRSIDALRERIGHLANIFLPDSCRQIVDVFDRVHARRELRSLIDEAVEKLQRNSALQVIELLFYGDSPMVRKVATIYRR